MFGVNDITRIFAPAFKKSTETITATQRFEKNLEFHLIKTSTLYLCGSAKNQFLRIDKDKKILK